MNVAKDKNETERLGTLASVDEPVSTAKSLADKILRHVTVQSLTDMLEIVDATNKQKIYDVVVVGGGPAGLMSALSAAANGLSAVVIEKAVIGGQAGMTAKVDSHLGGADGLEGPSHAQAQGRGLQHVIFREVICMTSSESVHRLEIGGGQSISGRTVVIATGAKYRRLEVTNGDYFENKGIHYAATGMEAALCVGEDVVVVGGGNAAGQAAVFLGGVAHRVHVLIRGDGLGANVSSYLTDRIHNSPHINLHPFTEVVELHGNARLEQVVWRNIALDVSETHNIQNLFVMIGAVPNVEWLNGQLALDERGFVRTGMGAAGASSRFSTSHSGVFAVGDVRSASVKRVAAAASEGAEAIADVLQYIDDLDGR